MVFWGFFVSLVDGGSRGKVGFFSVGSFFWIKFFYVEKLDGLGREFWSRFVLGWIYSFRVICLERVVNVAFGL